MYVSPSIVNNIIKPKLDTFDQIPQIIQHSSVTAVTTWTQGIIVGNFCQSQFGIASKKAVKSLSRVDSGFSGLRGIWDGPSHCGNMGCGQANLNIFGKNVHLVLLNEDKSDCKWACTCAFPVCHDSPIHTHTHTTDLHHTPANLSSSWATATCC